MMRPEAKTAITIRRSQPIFILLLWEIRGTFIMLYGSLNGDVAKGKLPNEPYDVKQE
jgi:hypothetical protein